MSLDGFSAAASSNPVEFWLCFSEWKTLGKWKLHWQHVVMFPFFYFSVKLSVYGSACNSCPTCCIIQTAMCCFWWSPALLTACCKSFVLLSTCGGERDTMEAPNYVCCLMMAAEGQRFNKQTSTSRVNFNKPLSGQNLGQTLTRSAAKKLCEGIGGGASDRRSDGINYYRAERGWWRLLWRWYISRSDALFTVCL